MTLIRESQLPSSDVSRSNASGARVPRRDADVAALDPDDLAGAPLHLLGHLVLRVDGHVARLAHATSRNSVGDSPSVMRSFNIEILAMATCDIAGCQHAPGDVAQ
jgi:hypothetical protein